MSGPGDTMTVKKEVNPAVGDLDQNQVNQSAGRISNLLKDEILISPRVTPEPPKSLDTGEGKAIRVVDRRPKEADTDF